LENQEVARLNSTNDKILGLEFNKQKSIRYLSFIRATIINAVRAALLFLMVWLVYKVRSRWANCSHSIYIHFMYSVRFRNWAISLCIFPDEGEPRSGLKKFRETPSQPVPEHPVHLEEVSVISFKNVSFKYETARPKR